MKKEWNYFVVQDITGRWVIFKTKKSQKLLAKHFAKYFPTWGKEIKMISEDEALSLKLHIIKIPN